MLKKYFRFVFLLASLFHGLEMSSQEVEKFEGTKTINNTVFHLKYEYYLEDRDTILHGNYQLNKPIQVVDETAYFNFLSIQGYYSNNKVDGNWEVRSGTLRPVGGGVFKDYNYSFKVTGTEIVARGQLKNGQRHGNWKFYEWDISKSEIVDTLFYTDLSYATDSALGCISIRRGEKEFINAYFDKNALADGSWSYINTEDNRPHIREWKFENNHLVMKNIAINNTQYTIDFKQETATSINEEVMHLDSNYFEIIDLIASINDPDPYLQSAESRPTIPLLMEALERIQEVDSILYLTTGIQIANRLKVKLIKIPYQDSEVSSFKSIGENIKRIDAVTLDILGDPQINIAKISTWEIARYLSVLERFQSDLIESFRTLLDLYKSGNLEYIYRGKRLFKTLNFQTTVQLDSISSDGLKMADYRFHEFRLDEEEINLTTAETYINSILSEIDLIRDSLDFFIYEMKKEENLVGLETALINKYEEVKQLNDSIITLEFTKIAGFDIHGTLHLYMEKWMGDYSRLESIPEKMQQVEPLIDCFNRMERLIKTLENVPFNIKIIEEGYTRTVFNPYTFSNMDEKIKMPIYRSFNELLLPGVFENLKSLTCDKILTNQDNFVNLFEGMIELLKRDTRKEERRIRRVTDKQKGSDILGFNLIFN